MTYKEAKNQIARNRGYTDWHPLQTACGNYALQVRMDEAAKLYAIEKVKEALNVVADRCALKIRRHNEQILKGSFAYIAAESDHVEVDTESILGLRPELVDNIKNDK